jgi:hypothetical protein
MRAVFQLVFVGVLLGLTVVVAAPVPKNKDNPGPVTDEQMKESVQNLKKIGLAIHNFESVYGFFPNNVTDENGKLLLSWRVAILAFLEQEKLYEKFILDEPWDSKNNKPLADKIPKIYAPIRVKGQEVGDTFYRGFTGPDTCFEKGKQRRIVEIADGTSGTILIVEAGEACIWTKPDDLPFDAKKKLPKLGGLFEGEFHILMCDASVCSLKLMVPDDVMKAMITTNGGEVVELEKYFQYK